MGVSADPYGERSGCCKVRIFGPVGIQDEVATGSAGPDGSAGDRERLPALDRGHQATKVLSGTGIEKGMTTPINRGPIWVPHAPASADIQTDLGAFFDPDGGIAGRLLRGFDCQGGCCCGEACRKGKLAKNGKCESPGHWWLHAVISR